MKIDGQCHCGAIAYEAEIDPAKVCICHCEDCQSLPASAYRTVAIVPAADFRLTKGTPKEYVKTAASGNRRAQAFCGACGSGLYATNADGAPEAYNIRLGTANQRHEIEPAFELWRQSALPWLPDIASTKKFDEGV